MNKCIFIGRLTADPELRTMPSGISVCRFGLAVDRPRQKDKEKEADFLTMTAWRQRAEFIAKYMHKGSKVAIDSSVRVSKYEKDGKARYSTEFVVNEVEFAESRSGGGSRQSQPEQSDMDGFTDIEGSEEDLPF